MWENAKHELTPSLPVLLSSNTEGSCPSVCPWNGIRGDRYAMRKRTDLGSSGWLLARTAVSLNDSSLPFWLHKTNSDLSSMYLKSTIATPSGSLSPQALVKVGPPTALSSGTSERMI
jgi:hypothetical protein